ncbi:hypothetical protein H257_02267 [Aphanomyces astaci]|uniref:Uncharacterized protein n=1 Tax=Aphanomyces astaci TaxID=112090 RepID=W4H335_APHAT|nr:hypothetical protein H257_02267 [Aphanomyces astaci]ETV85649.1 hypothetical protein H257_02267 [Aphanomyces astaci]|eukprot:XP_009824121.1 hypothetical protein H257_02267 [Aphanomyces astaci]
MGPPCAQFLLACHLLHLTHQRPQTPHTPTLGATLSHMPRFHRHTGTPLRPLTPYMPNVCPTLPKILLATQAILPKAWLPDQDIYLPGHNTATAHILPGLKRPQWKSRGGNPSPNTGTCMIPLTVQRCIHALHMQRLLPPPNPNLSCSLPPNYPGNFTSAPSRASYYRAGYTTQRCDPPPSLHHGTSGLVNGWEDPMALHFMDHSDAPPTALSPVPRLTTTGGSMPLTTPTPPLGGAYLPWQYMKLPLITRRPPTGLSFPMAHVAIQRLSSYKQHGSSPYPRASSHFATSPPSTTPPRPTGENSLLLHWTAILQLIDATHWLHRPPPTTLLSSEETHTADAPRFLTAPTHCLHWAQTSIPDYDPYALDSRAFLTARYPTIHHATPGWTTFPTITHSTQAWAASITHLRAPLFHTHWFVAHWAVLRRHWQTTCATNVDHIRTTGELPLLTEVNNTIRLKRRYHDAAPMGHDRRIRARRAHLTAKTLQWHSRRISLLQPAIPPPIGYADPTLRPPRLPPDPGLPPPAV